MNARRVYCTSCIRNKRRSKWFVNMLILLCLGICLYITINTVTEYHRLDVLMDAGVLGVLVGMWGGELLLIVVRQVLGKGRRDNENEENNDGGTLG